MHTKNSLKSRDFLRNAEAVVVLRHRNVADDVWLEKRKRFLETCYKQHQGPKVGAEQRYFVAKLDTLRLQQEKHALNKAVENVSVTFSEVFDNPDDLSITTRNNIASRIGCGTNDSDVDIASVSNPYPITFPDPGAPRTTNQQQNSRTYAGDISTGPNVVSRAKGFSHDAPWSVRRPRKTVAEQERDFSLHRASLVLDGRV